MPDSEVVATKPFTYAGTYRFAGEVFALGGYTNDSALEAVGYVRPFEPSGDEVEDAEGRQFITERHAELALAHQAERDAEQRAKAAARAQVEGRFEERERALAEEQRVHRSGKWDCPSAVDIGGCGRPVSLGGIERHIAQHAEPNRSRIRAEHDAQHAAQHDRSVPASANLAANAHDAPKQ